MEGIEFGIYVPWKRDVSFPAACQGCGTYRRLNSYSGRYWFHVYWLPLIPLWSRRVLYDCQFCERAFQADLAEWEAGGKAVAVGLRRFLNNPRDAEVLREALDLSIRHHDAEAFSALAEGAEKFYGADPEILAFVANGYMVFGDPAKALALRREAYALDDSTENRLALAEALVQGEHLSEAESLLRPIPEEGNEIHLYLLNGIRRHYFRAGDRERAKALREELKRLDPDQGWRGGGAGDRVYSFPIPQWIYPPLLLAAYVALAIHLAFASAG